MTRPSLKNSPKIVGLYVDPPAHAMVLSFDEKSQIQTLDRTQPGLPMKKGRAGTTTHDYKALLSEIDLEHAARQITAIIGAIPALGG